MSAVDDRLLDLDAPLRDAIADLHSKAPKAMPSRARSEQR
jgi:hypothetical protein